MRHTAGFTYGAFGNSAVDKMYREKKLLIAILRCRSSLPNWPSCRCNTSPARGYHYSVGVDVLGRVVEVASGRTLDVFFEDRIFKPLDMVDTAFYVPASKVDRFAANYGPGLTVIDDPAKSPYLNPRSNLCYVRLFFVHTYLDAH